MPALCHPTRAAVGGSFLKILQSTSDEENALLGPPLPSSESSDENSQNDMVRAIDVLCC